MFERATPRPFHRNIEKESNVVGSRSLATSGSSNFEEAILKRTETQAIDYSLDGSAGPSHESRARHQVPNRHTVEPSARERALVSETAAHMADMHGRSR